MYRELRNRGGQFGWGSSLGCKPSNCKRTAVSSGPAIRDKGASLQRLQLGSLSLSFGEWSQVKWEHVPGCGAVAERGSRPGAVFFHFGTGTNTWGRGAVPVGQILLWSGCQHDLSSAPCHGAVDHRDSAPGFTG